MCLNSKQIQFYMTYFSLNFCSTEGKQYQTSCLNAQLHFKENILGSLAFPSFDNQVDFFSNFNLLWSLSSLLSSYSFTISPCYLISLDFPPYGIQKSQVYVGSRAGLWHCNLKKRSVANMISTFQQDRKEQLSIFQKLKAKAQKPRVIFQPDD